jgi:hypothetical protein
MSIGEVIEGTYKNIMNRDEELYLQRIAICHKCKLLKKDKIFGEICNSTIYLNPTTNELSPIPKPGFQHGCGCVINSKTRILDTECPLKK